jgi:hypothetical protein
MEMGDHDQRSGGLNDSFNTRMYSSAPVLRPVPDVQDFDNFLGGTVHNDIGRTDQFAGSLHLSGSAKAGKGRQLFNAVENRLSSIPGCSGIVLLDAFHSGFKLI